VRIFYKYKQHAAFVFVFVFVVFVFRRNPFEKAKEKDLIQFTKRKKETKTLQQRKGVAMIESLLFLSFIHSSRLGDAKFKRD